MNISSRSLPALITVMIGLGVAVGWKQLNPNEADRSQIVEARHDSKAAPPRKGFSNSGEPTLVSPMRADHQRVWAASGVDAFAARTWLTAKTLPPPDVATLPSPTPPAPTAPPLPFSFVGMVEKGAGLPRAFLAKGDALLVVSLGDLIDNGTYRVDALSPTSVVLMYMPLSTQQTITVSGGSK